MNQVIEPHIALPVLLGALCGFFISLWMKRRGIWPYRNPNPGTLPEDLHGIVFSGMFLGAVLGFLLSALFRW